MYSKRPIPLPKVAEAGAEPLLTPSAFAKASGVSLSTVWRRLRRGELSSVKRAGKRLISAVELGVNAVGRPVDEHHPMWKLIGCAKSGGAGPGSSDKYLYINEEASARNR